MKKLFLLFALFGFLTFTTAACGGGGETEATEENADSTATETPAEEPAEEPAVEPMEEDTTVADSTATPVEEVE